MEMFWIYFRTFEQNHDTVMEGNDIFAAPEKLFVPFVQATMMLIQNGINFPINKSTICMRGAACNPERFHRHVCHIKILFFVLNTVPMKNCTSRKVTYSHFTFGLKKPPT